MDLSRGIAYGRHAGLEKYYMYVLEYKIFIWTRVASFNP